MSDVEKDTEDVNRKSVRTTADAVADETPDEFEGHRKGDRNAIDDPSADDGNSDFEGHRKSGRQG
jgi:hypothetical protein